MINLSIAWVVFLPIYVFGYSIICFLSSKDLKKFLFCGYNIAMIAILSICAYHVSPNPGVYSDMHRISDEIQFAHMHGLTTLFERYSINPLSAAILSIGYFTNYRVVQFLAALIFYSVLFFAVGVIKNSFQLSDSIVLWITIGLFLANDYIGITQNIRLKVGVSFLALGLICYFVWRKSIISIILCTISILIHISLLLPVCLLILAHVTQPKYRKVVACVLLFCIFITPYIVAFLSQFRLPVISQLLSKLYSYVPILGYVSDSSFASNQHLIIWFFYYLFIFAALSIVLIYKHSNFISESSEYYSFAIFLISISLGLSSVFEALVRYGIIVFCLSLPLFGITYNHFFNMQMNVSNTLNYRTCKKMIIFISISIFYCIMFFRNICISYNYYSLDFLI